MWDGTEYRFQQIEQYASQEIGPFNAAFNGNILALNEGSNIVLSDDGAYIVAASKQGTVHVEETGTRRSASLPYTSPIHLLALSPDGRTGYSNRGSETPCRYLDMARG